MFRQWHPWLRALLGLSLIGFGVYMFFRHDPPAQGWLIAAGCICICGGALAWTRLRCEGILLFHMGLGVSWIGRGLLHHHPPVLVLGLVAVSVFPTVMVTKAVRMALRMHAAARSA